MALDAKQLVCAHVLMRPASGKRLPRDAVITSDNLSTFVPADQDVRYARDWFERAGFRSGELAGISFSIEGPVGLFEKIFKTKLLETEKGGLARAEQGGAGLTNCEMPLEVLPEGISGILETITFSAPLDFGPVKSFF